MRHHQFDSRRSIPWAALCVLLVACGNDAIVGEPVLTGGAGNGDGQTLDGIDGGVSGDVGPDAAGQDAVSGETDADAAVGDDSAAGDAVGETSPSDVIDDAVATDDAVTTDAGDGDAQPDGGDDASQDVGQTDAGDDAAQPADGDDAVQPADGEDAAGDAGPAVDAEDTGADAGQPDTGEDAGPVQDVADAGADAGQPDTAGDGGPSPDAEDASADGGQPDAAGDAGQPDAGDAGSQDAGDAGNDAAVVCVPAQPPVEQCNGADDNCDGKIDEGTCDDANPCTADLCNGAIGAGGSDGCKHESVLGACSDGDSCTVDDACKGGKCAPGPVASCSDGVDCTADDCVPKQGCTHTPKPAFCDDGKLCTADTCIATGCKFSNNTVPCDDNDACTAGDACKDGACQAGSGSACVDNNPCTTDSCSKGVGCVYTPVDAKCDDGNPCSGNDTCIKGTCQGIGGPDCDDKNPCTDDGCSPSNGCLHDANQQACNDGDPCTVGDVCGSGNCKGKGVNSCDDGNACTDDGCKEGKGCVSTDNTASCDDGDTCTEKDTCFLASCKAGPAKACNDGNACTDDACDSKTGCTAKPNTLGCDDGDACTDKDTCDAGKCAGKPLISEGKNGCADANICTNDACDPKVGCTWSANTAACQDGSACTEGDACKAGTCTAGPAKVCDDASVCTTDVCDAAKGCVTSPAPGVAQKACDGTIFGGRCYRGFTQNATFSQASAVCQGWGGTLTSIASAEENAAVRKVADGVCPGGLPWIGLTDAEVEGTWKWLDGTPYGYKNWSPNEPNDYLNSEDAVQMLVAGTWNDAGATGVLGCLVCERSLPIACSDGDACTSSDTCTAAGACKGAGGCDDGNPCTTDSCGGDAKCTSTAVSDGTSCGSGGACSKGVCDLGTDAKPALSCAALLAAVPATKSGTYWLDPDGAGPVAKLQAVCEMSTHGGGWTLIAVVSDDAQATWTWNNRLYFSSNNNTFGSLAALTKDYKSPLYHQLSMQDILFVHAPSGVWAAYGGVGDGKASLAGVVATVGGPHCYIKETDGYAMAAGTLVVGGNLCSTRLYLSPADHDAAPLTCGNDLDPEPSYGPAWSANNGQGCPFDDPGISGGLGPFDNVPTIENGNVGFGHAAGLNKGTIGSGQNRMWIGVR